MEELNARIRKGCAALEGALGVSAFGVDMTDPLDTRACPAAAFCHRCAQERPHTMDPHRYGINEASRWGGEYVYYCPQGLTFLAGAVQDAAGALAGGLILGPLVMGEVQDVLSPEDQPELRDGILALPRVSPQRVRCFEELLRHMTRSLSTLSGQDFAYDRQSFLNAMYDIRNKYGEDHGNYAYIYAGEKRLQSLITQRDREGSQELLNELLGHIYFTHGGDIANIKARVMELVVVLSRAAVVAGADVAEMFRFSTEYLRQIETFESIDEVSMWLSGVVHRFISASFDYAQIKHSDVVRKVTGFIRDNLERRLTLEEIAAQVYLSKSYLSSIFKQEMGVSISSYINRARVERSKHLLRETNLPLVEIAAQCCFEDQSYFSKVFKRYAGISPKKYRDSQL